MNCVATTGTTGELQGGNDFVLDPVPPEPIPEKAPLGERDASWRSPTWALRLGACTAAVAALTSFARLRVR